LTWWDKNKRILVNTLIKNITNLPNFTRQGSRPDRTLARNWEKEHRKMASETSTSINFYGDLQNNGVIASKATENRSVTNTSTIKRKRSLNAREAHQKSKAR
jgi:hypothetical protein